MTNGGDAGIGAAILEIYNTLMSALPTWAQNFLTLFLLVLLVVIYVVFIWKFYRFISTKNIIGLNLKKYSRAEHPFLSKLFVGGLSFIEYIIILPFLIFFWFGIFTIFLILLTESLELKQLLIISATVIAAIRMTAYIPKYGQKLAKEVAKLLPFTLLAVSVLNPNFFSIERITTHISQIPNFFGSIITYLLFIIVLEIILRFFEFIFALVGLEDETPSSDDEEEEEESEEESEEEG